MDDRFRRFYADAPIEWVDTGSERLPCRRFGGGPPLLLVHGFPLSGFTWRKLLPELARHRTCWTLDLPGLGGSEWSPATEFSFDGQGRTLKRLADRLGFERYAVIAQDTGGTFARYLALADQARVEKLILLNTEMPHHRPPWIPTYQMLMRVPGSLAVLGLTMKSRSYLRSPMGFGGCFADLDLIDGDFRTEFVEGLRRSPRRMAGISVYLRGCKWEAVDALAHLHAKLTMPVALIWGAEDPTFPLEGARAMASQFPDARLVAVPGARLLVHEERPQEVVDAVLEFLG